MSIDERTVSGFGDEWRRFDQSVLSSDEKRYLFDKYFRIFPFIESSSTWEGFDAGCGSGRWASLVAPRVRRLHLIDASAEALQVARGNLAGFSNCEFHHCSVDRLPLADGSMDFGYSLGVLHHVPDTAGALAACVSKLKPGAPFLVYIYYAFDTRPLWFRSLWRLSDLTRRVISRLPHGPRYYASQAIAALVYWPIARVTRAAEGAGWRIKHGPLSFYARRSYYVIRTDALDRFGTRLEQRFTRPQIHSMMAAAGLERIQFSEEEPFWCAVGYRASQ